jgi:tungstate transport system ATP-binding protein
MSLSNTTYLADGHSSAGLSYCFEIERPSILPLTVTDLSFTAAGCQLLEGVSFVLQAGACLIVLGPNGAGKSLLLRLCHGLLPPASGSIDWAGLEPDTARQQLAMVFQRPMLLRRSAAANIAYALSIKGISRQERKRRVAEALARTDLVHLADRPAQVLSCGEQQRLAIARAWALQPQLLFLDEPTSNLDPAATQAIERLICNIHHTGTTLMMTTHDLGQARRLATEVLFLHQGHLLEQTPADEFFAHPRSAEAAAFLRGELLC